MRVSEKAYKSMPAELQSIFQKLPNPGRDEVVSLFPQARSAGNYPSEKGSKTDGWGNIGTKQGPLYADSGSAARFFKTCPLDDGEGDRLFYAGKASKRDRDEGCEGLPYALKDDCPLDTKKEIEKLLTLMR